MSEVADGGINREEGTSERRRRRSSADLPFELLPSSHLLLLLFLLARLTASKVAICMLHIPLHPHTLISVCVCVCVCKQAVYA